MKCHDTECDTECDAECDAKHDAKCARDLIGRNLILHTNLVFQAALGEAKSKIAPLRAALRIRH